MPYRLKRSESVQEGLHRIAREQIDRGVDEVVSSDLDPHETVHQVRKRMKKVRAALRLVRPALGEKTYSFENGWFRDAARRLSDVRDAEAIVETLDLILDQSGDPIDRTSFRSVRNTLRQRRKEITEEKTDIEEELANVLTQLREGKERLDGWKLSEEGFAAVSGGLKKTFARGCSAMEEAYEKPSPERFHEWRKRAKYHWHHARLLQSVWPEFMKCYRKEVHHLSDLLGDDHDLAVFRAMLEDERDRFENDEAVNVLLGLIHQQSGSLRSTARRLGERVFAEEPKRLVHRFEAYWEAWRQAS